MGQMTTRNLIVQVADDLFYRKGYEHTSFADIAEIVEISRGNFYFHFKTKDEILEAVIDRRLAGTREMLERWDSEDSGPADRIRRFIQILIANRADIMRYGCPVGTLCTELAKLDHASQTDANKLFTLFRTWLVRQFELLGLEDEADSLAMHLLARSQGVATLANAFNDERFIRHEVRQMSDWLDDRLRRASRSDQIRTRDKAPNRKVKARKASDVHRSA
jgi:AcrR family transcriptional regulator